ncbi:MAG TPA: glucoamylase family protein, partial [Prolixibacteraceae bacterium]|nr:glucoamylase family protein [Prolixibacteraceae bacterium]
SGWNECLVTYIMAAASPTHGIPKEVYEQGWARSGNMVNSRNYYNYEIKLAPNWGGPLFFIHYSHLGINPHGLKDQYADYWQEHVNTALIHYQYAIENPEGHENYSANNWGLTASDDPFGYTAHAPVLNDNGTISPTAALASMPYTPEESMQALSYFYRERGNELFGKFGTYDAFNDEENWISNSYLGIDQGPIVVMIENHRSGLLWKNVMKDEDVQTGLDKLGFQYEIPTFSKQLLRTEKLEIYPNPSSGTVTVVLPTGLAGKTNLEIRATNGQLVDKYRFNSVKEKITYDLNNLKNGIYMVRLSSEERQFRTKLVINK